MQHKGKVLIILLRASYCPLATDILKYGEYISLHLTIGIYIYIYTWVFICFLCLFFISTHHQHFMTKGLIMPPLNSEMRKFKELTHADRSLIKSVA